MYYYEATTPECCSLAVSDNRPPRIIASTSGYCIRTESTTSNRFLASIAKIWPEDNISLWQEKKKYIYEITYTITMINSNIVKLTCYTNNQQQYGNIFEQFSLHWLAPSCLCWELYEPFPPEVKWIQFLICQFGGYYFITIDFTCLWALWGKNGTRLSTLVNKALSWRPTSLTSSKYRSVWFCCTPITTKSNWVRIKLELST